MTKNQIEIRTEDGICAAGLFRPAGAIRAGVVLYMDVFGPRPGLDAMAERLAGEGYLTIVPDLFCRNAPYGPFDAATAFSVEESKAKLMAMLAGTTQDMTVRDAKAFIAALDEAGASGKIGVTGYCMGGARALNTAAAYPERIGAAASFHGGNLASDAPDSPHRRAAEIKARIYVGAAGVDGSFPPEQAARLAESLRRAEVDHIIENYVGCAHGWAVPDHRVFNHEGAERHWKRLLTLFEETIG